MTEKDDLLAAYLGIASLDPEGAVLRLLVELGVQVIGAAEGSLLVLDEDRGDLVFAMTTAKGDAAKALLGRRLPLGTGLTGLAAATREVQVGAPTYTFEGERRPGAGMPPDAEAVIAAPMLVGDVLAGVLTAVSFEEGRRFGADDVRLYARVASIAGVVVRQRRRIESLEALAAGAEPDPAGPERAPARIVRSLSRISRSGADLDRVADLLAAVERLLGTKG